MQLFRTLVSEYITKLFGIEYKIKNNDNKAKCEFENRNSKEIGRYLIKNARQYNIE